MGLLSSLSAYSSLAWFKAGPCLQVHADYERRVQAEVELRMEKEKELRELVGCTSDALCSGCC